MKTNSTVFKVTTLKIMFSKVLNLAASKSNRKTYLQEIRKFTSHFLENIENINNLDEMKELNFERLLRENVKDLEKTNRTKDNTIKELRYNVAHKQRRINELENEDNVLLQISKTYGTEFHKNYNNQATQTSLVHNNCRNQTTQTVSI